MAEKEYIERGALLRKVRYICDTYGVPKIICERLKKAMDKCTAYFDFAYTLETIDAVKKEMTEEGVMPYR